MILKTLFILLLTAILIGCQTDPSDDFDFITDTFVLVDYCEGVYKFVQIDNLYTIGVMEEMLDIPDDFQKYVSEEVDSYYMVDLRLTDLQKDSGTVQYQRYSMESLYYRVHREGTYQKIHCYVQRISFFSDYFYIIMKE